MSGGISLLVQKMKVLVTYCQTKPFLKLVIGDLYQILAAFSALHLSFSFIVYVSSFCFCNS